MKTPILFLLAFFFTFPVFKSFSQTFFCGVNSSFYADDLPPDLFGAVNVGVGKGRVFGGAEFTNCMGYRKTSFQLLGVVGRVNVRPNSKMFNVFFETHFATQISGKRKDTPVEYHTFLPIQDYNPDYKGDRFLRADFQGTLCVGTSFCFKSIEIYASFGIGSRTWSSYNVYNYNTVYKGVTSGAATNVGLKYHFSFLGKDNEK